MNKIINAWNILIDTFPFNIKEFIEALFFLFCIYLTSFVSYSLFHSIIEIFTIIVAFGIFIVAWNARNFFTNHFLLFLSIAYVFVSLIDIIHVLSYQGVGIFTFFDQTNNLPTQLWVAARYLQAFSLLIAPIFFVKKINFRLIFESYFLVLLLVFISIFYLRIFPTVYVKDVGLTAFKIISEYLISLILVGAAIFLHKKRKSLDKRIFNYILTSIIFTIASELAFTTYFKVFDFSNMLGHYFRLISFLLIYKTIVEVGVQNPLSYIFRNLEQNTQIIKASEQKFRSLTELSISGIVILNSKDKIDLWNSSAENIFGWKSKEMIGKNLSEIFPDENIKGDIYNLKQIISEKNLINLNKTLESFGKRKNGEIFPLEISFSTWKVKDESFFCYIMRDISQRRKNEKDLSNKKKKLEALVNDLKIFKLAMDKAFAHIVITDKDGVILYANKSTEEITGYNHDEIIGQTPSLWGKQMSLSFYEDFWRIIKIEKRNFTGEITNKRKNGELYQAEIRVSPVLGSNDEVEFFVALERDITEEREMDKAKTEFISLAAHQLKTPLTTISLASEILSRGIDGEMSKENKKHLKSIFMEIKGMTEMIDIFLNISRIEMGKFPIETESIKLFDILEKAVKEILPQTKDKKIHFKKEYKKNLPILNLDKKVMNIILENFLSNAVKYSQKNGEIILGVEENNNHIIIKVTDNGIGIPDSEQSKIFTKMFRANNVNKIKSNGSGLGLYLVKNLAEQSGFNVSFISKENVGTTFMISIPKNNAIAQKKFVSISNLS